MNNKPTYEELETKVGILEEMVKEKIEEACRFQSGFFSNIQTLLNIVIGISGLMTKQNPTIRKSNTYQDYVKTSCNNLSMLMENIFDVLLLETGQIEIKEEKCLINQLLDELYYSFIFEKHLQEKNYIVFLLTKEISDHDFAITTDPSKLRQVLTTLINNAFKFTERGVIEFGYSVELDDKLQFFIKDTRKEGLINTQCQVKNIPDSLVEDFGGSNLGLTTSKRIVDLLGGEFWSETNCLNGTTSRFTIPKKIYQEKD